jgi:hypothetical protein
MLAQLSPVAGVWDTESAGNSSGEPRRDRSQTVRRLASGRPRGRPDRQPRTQEDLMIFKKTLAAALLAGFAGAALSAQTADELVEKYIQAKGGRDKIKAVKTMRMTAKMTMGQGMEAPVVMELVPAEHKLRMEFTLQGMTGVQAYDGTNGWQVMPFLGKTDPEPMTGDDLKDVKENADLVEGPLFNYKDKGNTVAYLGKGDLEGTPVQKLKLTKKDGDVTTIYLDADSYLELKDETTRTIRGQATDLETTFGNYKQVEGLTLPFTIETKLKGAAGGQSQAIIVDKIEVNTAIPASRFEMPKAEKKQEAPKNAPPPKP